MDPKTAIVVIDGSRPDRVLATVVATAAAALGLVVITVADGAAALLALDELTATGHTTVAFVLGPHLASTIATAREIHTRLPGAHLVFAVDEGRDARLRHQLALAPGLGTGWTIARVSAEPITLALGQAVRASRASAAPAAPPRTGELDRAALTGRLLAARRRNARLEVTQALVDEPDLAAAGVRILRALGTGFDWSAAILWMVDPVADVLRCGELWRADEATLEEFAAASRAAVFTRGEGVPGRVWADRAPILVSDVVEDPTYLRAEVCGREGLHTAYIHPILIAREVVGVIELISARRRELDADQLDMIAASAVTIGQLAERRRIEQALRKHNDDLIARDRRKNEFIAVLAHELRNPLAPIDTALQILDNPTASADEHGRARGAIQRQLTTLSRLVEDLLDVARITTGKVQLRPERIELAPVIGRVVEPLRPAIDRHGLSLTVVMPSEPMWLDADPVRIEQVLTNLLVNAAKYTDRGGRIWLTAAPVGPTSGPRRVVIAVRDTGIGLSDDIRAHVFDMFAQAELSRSRDRSGLGIGLTLVKRLVELHGGEVSVASPGPYKGSEFSIRLPLLPMSFTEELRAGGVAAALDADAPTAPTEVPVVASPRGLRILIVDDNTDAADTLEIVLRRDGHEVRTCYDGPDAMTAAHAFGPDVVLLDLGLPGLSGYEVATRLRQDRTVPAPVLIALTGWGQEADREQTRTVGFDHHLLKPARLADIRAILESARAQRSQR